MEWFAHARSTTPLKLASQRQPQGVGDGLWLNG